MPHNFTAIDVGQGDAFYLKRDDVSILVDGGQSRKLIKARFTSIAENGGVDYLVCTHNDADHANGILGFLQAGLPCGEVWLPGSWTNRLDDLRDDEIQGLIEELFKDCFDPSLDTRKINRFTPLYNLGDDFSKRQDDQPNDLPDVRYEEGNEATILSFEAAEGAFGKELYSQYSQRLSGNMKRQKLFDEAIRAADRIRAIATAASKRRIPIRWFEFDNRRNARGGKSGILEPVNSVEISRFGRRKQGAIGALRYLALTTSNRESLVFCSPASDDFPGVLFLADSDLSFKQQLPDNIQLFTTPHHGSEANANAYTRLKMGKSTILVRSDARYKSRPGQTFLSHRAKKYCTVCRGTAMGKRPVRFHVTSGKWRVCGHQQCNCR